MTSNYKLNPHHYKKETIKYNPLGTLKQRYYGLLNEIGLVQRQSTRTTRKLGRDDFHGYF